MRVVSVCFLAATSHVDVLQTMACFGKYVAERVFKFTPKSDASAYTELLVAFFVSGVLHVGGDHMALRRFPTYTIPFFMTQAMGIVIETLFIRFTKSFHPNSVWLNRGVGYA